MLKITAILAIAAAAPLFAPAVRADVTNTVDVAALAACGTGETNGWTLAGVDSYSDGRVNVRLNSKDDAVLSPEFALPVRSILVKAKSSSAAGRRLAAIPVNAAGESAGEGSWRRCDYSASANVYSANSLDFARGDDVRRFRLALDGGGGTTGWGISELSVVTFDPPAASAPDDLAASDVRSRSFVASWTPDPRAVSYSLSLFEVRHDGVRVVLRHDFNDLSNKGDTSEKTDVIVARYPELEGSSLLGLPTNSTGLIQISQRDSKGVLAHRAFDDYEGLSLTVRLCRQVDADQPSTSVGYEFPDGVTNIHHTVGLATELRTVSVPLDGIPGGARLLVNADGNKKNHRVVLDEMTFTRRLSATAAATNLVRTTEAPLPGRARLKGLEPETDYILTVAATDADGARSAPSAPLAVRTAHGSDAGLVIKVRQAGR